VLSCGRGPACNFAKMGRIGHYLSANHQLTEEYLLTLYSLALGGFVTLFILGTILPLISESGQCRVSVSLLCTIS
jgi:hypothetical protein